MLPLTESKSLGVATSCPLPTTKISGDTSKKLQVLDLQAVKWLLQDGGGYKKAGKRHNVVQGGHVRVSEGLRKRVHDGVRGEEKCSVGWGGCTRDKSAAWVKCKRVWEGVQEILHGLGRLHKNAMVFWEMLHRPRRVDEALVRCARVHENRCVVGKKVWQCTSGWCHVNTDGLGEGVCIKEIYHSNLQLSFRTSSFTFWRTWQGRLQFTINMITSHLTTHS